MFTEADYQQLLIHFQERDPILHALLEKQGYQAPPPPRSLFSLLIGAIVGQRIRFTKARQLRGRIYTALGTDSFSLAQLNTYLASHQLTELGLNQSQIDTIDRVLQYLENHQLLSISDLEQLQTQITGIGPWTIRNVKIMWSLSQDQQSPSEADYLLTEDLIIRRGLERLYNDKVTQLAQTWQPYNGIVTWYLWKEFS